MKRAKLRSNATNIQNGIIYQPKDLIALDAKFDALNTRFEYDLQLGKSA